MAGKIVKKAAVKRKKGYLYFVDGDGNVRETPMANNRKKATKKKVATKKKATTKRKTTAKKSTARKRR